MAISHRAKLSGPLLVPLVTVLKIQSLIPPSTAKPVWPGVPQGLALAVRPGLDGDATAPSAPASHARPFPGTQNPQSCQGKVFQSTKKEKISPEDVS